jgi:hypothetical protein
LEIEVVDEIGQPLAKKPIEVLLANGEVKTLNLDNEGKARLPGVPARQSNISVNPAKAKSPQWPIGIKGFLYYERTWKYNTSTTMPKVNVALSGAKAELYIRRKGAAAVALHAAKIDLSDMGAFAFSGVPECDKAFIRVYLEHAGNKVVIFKGLSNIPSPDMEIRTGQVPWHDVELDPKILTGLIKSVELGGVRIRNQTFTYLCDAYMTICFGHSRLAKISGYSAPQVTVNYPEPSTSTSHLKPGTKQLYILDLDLRDRDVLLHEYGHFIAINKVPLAKKASYKYNDDPRNEHTLTSNEHYEAAWNEAIGTFLSLALSSDPVYRDGYDANLTINLRKSSYTIGHHNETTILQALWDLFAVQKADFKKGFWVAWTDTGKRTVSTSVDFFDNWKELGLKELSKLIKSYRKYNLEFAYRYSDGADKFTAVAPPKSFNQASKEFATINELYNAFSKPLSGSQQRYPEEFYNRNKEFNAGSLGPGSTPTAPNITVGKSYIVPKLVKLN